MIQLVVANCSAMGISHKILAGLVHLTAATFVVMIVINALGGAGYKGKSLLIFVSLNSLI